MPASQLRRGSKTSERGGGGVGGIGGKHAQEGRKEG